MASLQQLAGILEYVASDYAGAVGDHGELRSEGEYEEQVRLAARAASLAREAGIRDADPIMRELGVLREAVEAKAPPARVRTTCRSVRSRVEQIGVVVEPHALPDRRRARELFVASGCVGCHGTDGAADTPTVLTLTPRPASFLDAERMRGLSASRAFFAITYGIVGTGMTPFGALSEADRWSLAYHVLALRHDHDANDVTADRHSFEDARSGVQASAKGLASLSEEELEASLARLEPGRRAGAIAFLRCTAPFEALDGSASAEQAPRASTLRRYAFIVSLALGTILLLGGWLAWRRIGRKASA